MIEGHLIVIGAMKAGTTTLHKLLSTHPDLIRGRVKELDYFDGRRWSGPEGYDALFPAAPGHRPIVTLDASPAYAKWPGRSPAPGRIAAMPRPVHLVYLLREPLDRALSHLRHNIAKGRVDPDGLAEMKRIRRYVMASRYSAHIEDYEAAGLGPRLLLLDFETLCRDPAAAVAQVCRHAGLAPHAVAGPVHANRGSLPAQEIGGPGFDAVQERLRHNLSGERARMIGRHGFEPARRWAVLGPQPYPASPEVSPSAGLDA